MYAFKRVLVGLDLTEMDSLLIDYTAHISKLLEVEKVVFLHVAKDLDLPKEITDKYPDLLAPIDESIEGNISEKLKGMDFGCPHDIEVREGDATEKIMRLTETKEIDLIIMGRKFGLKGKGVLPGKIAKLALSSIWFVPEGAAPIISKIVVPTDFSKTSKMALEKAVEIAEDLNAEVVLQNSFSVPSVYYKTGKTFEQFSEIMKKNAEKDLTEFMEGLPESYRNIPCIHIQDEEEEPSERAYEVARKEEADLIVIGSRGRTGIASILLGSIAEKMTLHKSNIPLLIIKQKKANLGFVEALFRL